LVVVLATLALAAVGMKTAPVRGERAPSTPASEPTAPHGDHRPVGVFVQGNTGGQFINATAE
jgi:hypothetical protein